MKKSQIKKLDKIWSEKVKERAGYKCEYCLESHGWLNSCHIIGRANRTLRWDLENGICLCYTHHKAYDTHQIEHENIRKIVIGENRIDSLIKKKQVIAKHQDYEEIKRLLNEN